MHTQELETIKQFLKLTDDTTYDDMITDLVIETLAYTHRKTLPNELCWFVSKKIRKIMNIGNVSTEDSTTATNPNIKSISDGMTSITYHSITETVSSYDDLYGLSLSDKDYLKEFRRCL